MRSSIKYGRGDVHGLGLAGQSGLVRVLYRHIKVCRRPVQVEQSANHCVSRGKWRAHLCNGHTHCSRSAFIGSVRAAAQPGRRLPQHVTRRMIMGAARKLGASHTLTP